MGARPTRCANQEQIIQGRKPALTPGNINPQRLGPGPQVPGKLGGLPRLRWYPAALLLGCEVEGAE